MPFLSAFEIDLPKNYIERRDAMRERESQRLWEELDRSQFLEELSKAVSDHKEIDGIELNHNDLLSQWTRTEGYSLQNGEITVSLGIWDMNYPKLGRTKWNEDFLFADIHYDPSTNEIKSDGEKMIRFKFTIERTNRIFKKARIQAKYDSFEFGFPTYILPFGGIELNEANQAAHTTPAIAPR